MLAFHWSGVMRVLNGSNGRRFARPAKGRRAGTVRTVQLYKQADLPFGAGLPEILKSSVADHREVALTMASGHSREQRQEHCTNPPGGTAAGTSTRDLRPTGPRRNRSALRA